MSPLASPELIYASRTTTAATYAGAAGVSQLREKVAATCAILGCFFFLIL